ncbi:MAG TPA: hypothetical protein VHE82_02280 [Gemmatimonadaceae bacterium]|nr:hypothetical protein [Gemmatimonadaceae bacterium]
MLNIACFSRRVALAVGVLAVAAVTTPAQSLSYVGGLQYATGDFIFTQRTWSAYLSNGLSWSAGRLRASASVPLVMQPAGWLQYSGAGMMVPTGGMAGSAGGSTSGSPMGSGMNGGTMTPSSGMPFSRVGIGDPLGRIDVTLSGADAEHPVVTLVGVVKAPLANVNRGFGTGEWDAGAGLSSTVKVASISVFAEAVYWKLGNPPGGSVRNAVAYALSIGRALHRSRWSVLGTVSGASSLWTGLEAPVQAGMGIGYLLESGSSVFATAAAGLTRTAPAISTGLGWRVPLGKTR